MELELEDGHSFIQQVVAFVFSTHIVALVASNFTRAAINYDNSETQSDVQMHILKACGQFSHGKSQLGYVVASSCDLDLPLRDDMIPDVSYSTIIFVAGKSASGLV